MCSDRTHLHALADGTCVTCLTRTVALGWWHKELRRLATQGSAEQEHLNEAREAIASLQSKLTISASRAALRLVSVDGRRVNA